MGDTAIIRRGSVIGSRYEISGILGRGGMGVVYKAFDHVLEDPVAIKVLRPDIAGDAELVRRFRQEIRLARKVRHRNVCAIHEYVEDGALRCLSMELVEGTTLRQLLDRHGPFPAEEAFVLGIQAADGLQAIHEAGIIHRDLKTANLMRDPRGQIRLMDFGIAKEWRSDVTATQQVLGTPEYVSPEQARGERVDFRSDLYALGVVLYELFIGQVPFRGETPIATVMKHIHEPLQLDSSLGLPEPVLPVLRKALAKEPSLRYQTAFEVSEALRQVGARLTGGSYHTPTTPLPVETPLPRGTDSAMAAVAPGLAGDLKTMKLSTILRWIASGEMTGTLRLEGRSIQKQLFFSEGAISSTWSNDPRESLGQFLVRVGHVTEEQLFKALIRQEEEGRLLGTILVSEGVLDEEKLLKAMREKAEGTVYDLFLWDEGRFVFSQDEVPPQAPAQLRLDVPRIIAEGTRRREDWSRIRKTIPSGRVTFRCLDPHPEGLDAREGRLLQLAGRGKTVGDISLEMHTSDFDVAAGLHALCACGYLAVEAVGDEAQTAETLRAIRELLEIAERRLKEQRFDEALDSYEAVLNLDRLNQQAKKGLIAVVEGRERARARKTVQLHKVPVLRVDLASLTLANVDPQEAFILSRVNGRWDVQSILKLCPIAEDDAILAFARLLSRRIVELR
jgi:serine/threonine protein kinase